MFETRFGGVGSSARCPRSAPPRRPGAPRWPGRGRVARWTGRPRRRFAAEEREALRPLPAARFVLATWTSARIGPDIHASVAGTLYSLPWRHIGDRLDVRTTATMVQLFHRGQLVKTHPRKQRGKQTDLGDYPPEKIAFHMRTPTWCRRQARAVDPACVAVIDELLAENARDPGASSPRRPRPPARLSTTDQTRGNYLIPTPGELPDRPHRLRERGVSTRDTPARPRT